LAAKNFMPANDDKAVHGSLNLEKDSRELEIELLKAANGPFTKYSSEEMREACELIIRKKSYIKNSSAGIANL
jgi:hypothetical protein